MKAISDGQVETRKLEILQAAYQALAEKGFEGLRVRDVAEVVGINPATLYYYFPNKEDLIEGVSAYVFNCLDLTADELPGTPKEQLHNHLFRIYHRMRDEPQLFAVLMDIRLRVLRTSKSEPYTVFEDKWHAKLVKLLQIGIRQGYWPNYLEPESIDTAMIALMLGAGLNASLQPRKIEEIIQQLERWLTGR